jgi:hypothetical protein
LFGNNLFGNILFGGFDPPDLSPILKEIESKNFLPFLISEEPLFKSLTGLVDYVIHNYHVKDLKEISGLYDTFHPDFNPDRIINFLGGSGHIVTPLNNVQKRTLVMLLSMLYEIKGLRSGIELLMSSFGIPVYLYESWEVETEIDTGLSARKDIFESPIWSGYLEDSCSIAVVFDGTGRVILEGIEDDLKKSIEALLWVCARIRKWMWVLDFRNSEGDVLDLEVKDTLDFYDYIDFCSKFLKNGVSWCFLPKPILESEDIPALDRILVLFGEDDSGNPEFPIEEGVPIFIEFNPDSGGDKYGVASKEDHDYDGTDFMDGEEFVLNPWVFRGESDELCCPEIGTPVVFVPEDGDISFTSSEEFEDVIITLYMSDEIGSGEIDSDISFKVHENDYDLSNEGTQFKIHIEDNGEFVEDSYVFYSKPKYESGTPIIDEYGNYSILLYESWVNYCLDTPLNKDDFLVLLSIITPVNIKFSFVNLPPGFREGLT